MAKKNADGSRKTRQRAGRRQGQRVQSWRNVSASSAANASEVPQLAIPLALLERIIEETDRIFFDQAAFRASKQLASQRLKVLFDQGDKLTTVMKVIVKQHFGNGNDKLVEFGIQPLRSRPRPTVVPPVETETPSGIK